MNLAVSSEKSNGARMQSPVEAVRDRTGIVPITIEQYHHMIEEGIVPEDSTVELLRGMLVRKDRSARGENPMGQSPLHKAVVAHLTRLSVRLQTLGCHIQIQLPVLCPPDSEPEPDGSIVRGSPLDYLDRIAGPGDVSCVIEAAHSSLARDREDKRPLYAGARIPQYIIINLQNSTLEVHTEPDAASEQYRTRVTIEKSQTVTLVLPDGALSVSAAELLP